VRSTRQKLAESFAKAGNVVLPLLFTFGERAGKPDKPLPNSCAGTRSRSRAAAAIFRSSPAASKYRSLTVWARRSRGGAFELGPRRGRSDPHRSARGHLLR